MLMKVFKNYSYIRMKIFHKYNQQYQAFINEERGKEAHFTHCSRDYLLIEPWIHPSTCKCQFTKNTEAGAEWQA